MLTEGCVIQRSGFEQDIYDSSGEFFLGRRRSGGKVVSTGEAVDSGEHAHNVAAAESRGIVVTGLLPTEMRQPTGREAAVAVFHAIGLRDPLQSLEPPVLGGSRVSDRAECDLRVYVADKVGRIR